MATIVLGVVGAVAGMYIAGPAGALKGAEIGFAVGSTIGAVIDARSRKYPDTSLGRLNDLRISSSSFGTDIPQCWGINRQPVSIIWKTDLIEHENDSSGGGGISGPSQPTTKTYTYTASFIAALCLGMPAGRTITIDRLHYDDIVIYDRNIAGSTLPCRLYNGSETQGQDAMMVAAIGADAPAYRGLVTMAFQDLDVTNYGNRIPNISVEFHTSVCTLSQIFTEVCANVGLAASDLNVSGATDVVDGFFIAARQAARDNLVALTNAFLYDIVEIDGKITLVKRGMHHVAVITRDMMGAQAVNSGGTNGSNRLITTRRQEVDLPRVVEVNYFTATNYLQSFKQSSIRQTTLSSKIATISLNMTLSDQLAAFIAQREMYMEWVERTSYITSVPINFMQLTPGDVVWLQTDALGTLRRCRITDMEIGLFGPIKLSLVPDSAGAIVQDVNGVTAPPTNTNGGGIAVPTRFFAWSGVELRAADQGTAGFYVAGNGDAGWRGGSILLSVDSGASYQTVGSVISRSAFGAAATVLPTGTTTGFDLTSTVSVGINYGQLASTNEADVSAGFGNYGLLLNGDVAHSHPTNYELFGFATATLTGPLTYTLSDLKRGLNSTLMSSHTNTDVFVNVSQNIVRIPVAASLAGQTVLVKVVSPGQDPTTVSPLTVYIATPTETATQKALDGLQAGIAALGTPITGAAIQPPPYYQMQYTYGTVSSANPGAFTGLVAAPFFANGPDGALRYTNPGRVFNSYWTMKLKNTTAADIVVTWACPVADGYTYGAWNGSSLFTGGPGVGGGSGTFTIVAGTTGLLELIYANAISGSAYSSTAHSTFWFFMNALSNSGVQFIDAITGLPPGGIVQATDITNWNSSATLAAGSMQKAANLSDVINVAIARTNLGLGTASVKNTPAVGNAAPTEIVLGTDTRLVAQKRRIPFTLYPASTTADTAPNLTQVIRLPKGSANVSAQWKLMTATLRVEAPSGAATTVQLFYTTNPGNAAFGAGTTMLAAILSATGAANYEISTTTFTGTLATTGLPSGTLIAPQFSAPTGGSVEMEFEEV